MRGYFLKHWFQCIYSHRYRCYNCTFMLVKTRKHLPYSQSVHHITGYLLFLLWGITTTTIRSVTLAYCKPIWSIQNSETASLHGETKGKPQTITDHPNGTQLVIIHPVFTEHRTKPDSGLDGKKESACKAGDSGLIPGWEDPLEKGTATHSSILTWRIPWTEEPGRLKSMRSQRVGHN